MRKAWRGQAPPGWTGILFVLTGLPLIVSGQAEVLFFNRLSADDSLTAQSNNYYIHKDSTGFAWISSILGLNRFDGHTVKPYRHRPDNPFSLADDNIQSPFFDAPGGSLWFATYQALHQYDRKHDRFHRHQIRKNGVFLDRDYHLFYLDPEENALWVGVKDELYIFPANGKGDTVRLGAFALISYLTQVVPGGRAGEHYLINMAGSHLQAVRFRNRHEEQIRDFRLETAIPGLEILSLFPERETRLWVGGNRGLLSLDLSRGDVRSYFPAFNGLPVDDITGIAPAPDGRLLLASRKKGLYYFDPVTGTVLRQIYRDENGLVAPFQLPVDKITIDRDHTLWVSTAGQGVFYTNLKKKKFDVFLQNQHGKPTEINFIKALSEDPQGRIWCLTRDGIVVLDKSGARLPGFDYLRESGVAFANDIPFYLRCDRSGNVWVSTNNGLYVRPATGRAFVKIAVDVPLRKPSFISIAGLANGRVLASSETGGIFEARQEAGGSFRLFPVPGLDTLSDVSWMYEDAGGGLLFFCRYATGITVFRRGESGLAFLAAHAFQPIIHTLLKDRDEPAYWLATSQGLYRAVLTEGGLSVTQEEAYPRQVLNGLLQDREGRLWAGTDRGLVRYDPDGGESRLFRVSEGLQAQEFNFWACLETRDGRFAFGGVNGINLFDPLRIEDLTVEAHPQFTHIRVNDEIYAGLVCANTGATNVGRMEKLRLPYRLRTLSFHFAPLEYSDPGACGMTYQMIGLDPHPLPSGPDRFARYANLPPGKYVFEVRAANSDGVWAGEAARLDIIIRPPWWRQRWFYALVGLSVAGAAYLLVRAWIRRIRKKEEALREAERRKRREAEHRQREAEFRQREAEFAQREAEFAQLAAETETAILRLQMNPHFIFNSMNSISSYILKRDVDTANDYLGRFSTLMRMILKLSEMPFIPLATELELLEQYLRTEAMRLENRFDYRIEIETGIDPDETIVPTMILQPFVENAIWHGLSGKKGKGLIRIGIRREPGGGLHCTVEDNGIGRAAAAARKPAAKDKKDESRALSITARRLALLASQEGQPAAFEIVDLFNEAGQAAGTQVRLQLPWLE